MTLVAIAASALAVLLVFVGSAQSRSIRRPAAVHVTAIAAGAEHVCALLSSGRVKCWGGNLGGVLGFGRTPAERGGSHQRPVLIKGISTARAVASGGYDSCALLAAGTVACWGQNDLGQVGNGASNPYDQATAVTAPAIVKGLTGAKQISVGLRHACALLSNGTVKCWGSDYFGQLGVPRPASGVQAVPVTVPGLSGVVSVAAGNPFTCALLASGGIDCWGDNQNGELGDGVTAVAGFGQSSTTPVAVKGITTAKGLAAGGETACALLAGGSVRCWGLDFDGELGNGVKTGSPVLVPVTVRGISSATSLAISGSDIAGGGGGGGPVCALLSGGGVRCWGEDSYGDLGNGKLNVDSPVPVVARGVSGAVAVSTGAAFSCALRSTGVVECWGSDTFGQLGAGAKGNLGSYSLTPVTIRGLP
jgi:alpha-tubulin suppressor-like RCC1 family protein